ncbi:Cupin 2 conserved barrel domain protein [Haloterrigena turkmenica DSM 5511]|uniref:Cupin 2 conserved barrel domain protein n=1 Tax=Haloterrigena turkmenica (strain ATCC 51198 / DSM 5511 / JCM 9101 / NCIMB 13204 / VKM B-1734 / 4k) TaxID=543526 RepID=D2RS65_HALTV|nr:cupin domain-containing protein [Haloterrigena turkmenica]ADB60646.1 Cupin 2 conserved barrel domain protein [Haloterrigena turkmenica DSM 5511]
MTDTDQLATRTERRRLDDLEETPHAHVFDGEPRTVRLELAAGEGVPAHRHPERTIVCHVLKGTLEIRLGDEEYVLEAGELLKFDGRQEIAPEARTDATALLVLAPRADD